MQADKEPHKDIRDKRHVTAQKLLESAIRSLPDMTSSVEVQAQLRAILESIGSEAIRLTDIEAAIIRGLVEGLIIDPTQEVVATISDTILKFKN